MVVLLKLSICLVIFNWFMDASYSIFTKFRLKSLVVLFTQSAILIYLGCYALYQLRIDPLSALAKKYLRFIGWQALVSVWRFFWKIPSLFLTLTNILILSLKLTTETFLKIFIQSFSPSPLSTSVIVIFLCRFLKRRC